MKKTLPFFLLALALSLASLDTFSQAKRFVKPVPSGNGDGSSWANASDDIQAMIDASGTQEVWVAAGTYRPSRPMDNRTEISPLNPLNAFVLRSDVKIYGGFGGYETTLGQRSKAEPSILSGDLDQNDRLVDGISGEPRGENAFHVVISNNNSENTLLDGFTITGGTALYKTYSVVNNVGVWHDWGGGIHITRSSAKLANLTIAGNYAADRGGAVSVGEASSVSIHNSFILGNSSVVSGGGIYNQGAQTDIINSAIRGNVSRGYGGGIYSTGGIKVVNALIAGNKSLQGGGIFHDASNMEVISSTIAGNNADLSGGIRCSLAATPSFTNTIIAGNADNRNLGAKPQFTYSLVAGVELPGINVPTDAQVNFVEPADPDYAPSLEGDYRLLTFSDLLNQGTPDAGSLDIPGRDLAGNPRVQQGRIDLGAYEGGLSHQSRCI